MLHKFWSKVKTAPFFADHTGRHRIRCNVWKWDWEALGETEQKDFAVSNYIPGDQMSSTLFKLSNRDFPDVKVVEMCVANGADICFRPPGFYWPVLHRFLFAGNIECVAACLSTTQRIDFTTSDRYNCTPLQLVCRNSMDNKASEEEIMRLIVKRLKEHPEDVVNWGQKNDVGWDFINRAASAERLSVLWTIVKDVPYFRSYKCPIPIITAVYRSDWNQLSSEDQARFDLQKGFD